MKSEATKLKLSFPFEWGKEIISEIELRRPKGKDIRHISSQPTLGEILDVAGKCCLHKSGAIIIDELDAFDATKVSEVINGFLDNGPKTGSQTSE